MEGETPCHYVLQSRFVLLPLQALPYECPYRLCISPEEGLEPQLADIAALPVKLLRHMLPRYSQGVCHNYTAIPLTLTREALPAESTLIIIFTGRFSGVAVITVCNAIMQ